MPVRKPLEPVDAFLKEAKKCIRAGRIVFPRRVLSGMELLGMVKQEAFCILESLSAAELNKGPEADRNMPGVIWVFRKETPSYGCLYIKLKLVSDGNGRVVCISLHEWGRSCE
ncbi:MAG: type II toxin-antitoxin system MqsR family toxin [Candidatus Fermentibacter sp.]|nr:type II toxin-antitoxin system MqsR family toxin [Candidatus Fermentibacter sp.]